MAFEFTDSNFGDSVKEGVTVVDFWAEWCGPCKLIGPIIEELATEYDEGKVKIGKVNVDNNPNLSFQYKVRSIPTVLIIKNGEVVERQVGLTTKQALKTKIDAHLS